MRTSTLTFLCLVMAAAMQVGPAPAQQPTDVPARRVEKDRQRAIEACSRVIADATQPASVRSDALLTRALIYDLLRATDFETAIESDPANPAVRRRRGSYHLASGRFEQALGDYNEAIRLGPADAAVHRGRGDVWLKKKRYMEAIADYQMALQLKPVAASTAWGQCQASASVPNAFFHCIQVADDTSQPAEIRADAQRRLDRMMGRAATAR